MPAEVPTPLDAPPVRRRVVLYLGGFDPQGPAPYHAMAVDAAAQRPDLAVRVGPRTKGDGPHVSAWALHWQGADGSSCDTQYLFLRWDDLVRQQWPRSRWRLAGLTLGTTARMAANGSLWRILQTSWPAFLALALPGASLLLLGALGLLGGGALAAAARGLPSPWGLTLAVAGAIGGGWGLSASFRWLQSRVQMDWLMRSARYILRQARGLTPELEARIDLHAERLAALAGQGAAVDEVVVVGHSSGCMLAVSVVARALAAWAAHPAGERPRLSLLTLGQCIPMLSYQPAATAFRAELATLRGCDFLHWADISAPVDGCCFALTDATAVCLDHGDAAAPAPGAPRCLNPRWAQCFSPERYRRLKQDKMACHFQYLRATEHPGPCDTLTLITGPRSVAEATATLPAAVDYRSLQRFGSPRR